MKIYIDPDQEREKLEKDLDLLMRALKIFDILINISDYQTQVYSDMSSLDSQKFINKWQSAYERVMQMKAFL